LKVDRNGKRSKKTATAESGASKSDRRLKVLYSEFEVGSRLSKELPKELKDKTSNVTVIKIKELKFHWAKKDKHYK
jgi:hypothetical protein